MRNSRTKNTVLTIRSGMVSQIVTVVFSFVTRTVFIRALGLEYLGISGLFTNILSFLSLAELGIGSAITFYLYKPLAEGDTGEIKSIMRFYRFSYRIIGTVILLAGLALVPALPSLIKIKQELHLDINLIYLLFLLNSVVSYWFFAYRITIIGANQQRYLVNQVYYRFTILSSVSEIAILYFFRDFIAVLATRIVLQIARNIVLSRKAGALYPYINDRDSAPLGRDRIRAILANVYSISVFSLSARLFESTGNIIISAVVGTVYVGIHSNYLILMNSVTNFTNIIRGSFVASVGNLNAIESTEKKYLMFRNLDFYNFWISGFCAVCFFQLMNPFIRLWLGEEFLFPKATVAIIAFNFLTNALLNIHFLFRETMGLFKYGKYRMLAGGTLNIVLSLVFARIWGVFGVFLATTVSGLTVAEFIFPKIVYEKGFGRDPREYYLLLVLYIALAAAAAAVVHFLCIPLEHAGVAGLLGQALVCLVVPNALFWVVFRFTREYRYLRDKVSEVLRMFVSRGA